MGDSYIWYEAVSSYEKGSLSVGDAGRTWKGTMKVSGQMVAHDIQVVAPTRLETAAALLTLAAICARAGRTADARDRISQAAALIAQCPDSDFLASQFAAQHRAAPLALVPPPRGRVRRPDGLSAREAEVLQLLTSGSTNLEIASALVVSVHTVERHLQNAYRKIGVRNRADAAAYMARHETPRPDGRKLLRQ